VQLLKMMTVTAKSRVLDGMLVYLNSYKMKLLFLRSSEVIEIAQELCHTTIGHSKRVLNKI
jgi:hypothetical protein